MHEFDKCNFCMSWQEGCCYDHYCTDHSDYVLDVSKILAKADEMDISVTDVLNLIRECNPKKPKPVTQNDPYFNWIAPVVNYSHSNASTGDTYIPSPEKHDWDVMGCDD